MTREYQTIAEVNILEALESNQRVMFSLATGLGKTICVTNLIRLFLHRGSRVIFIAHRQELIQQAWATFNRHGITSGIIMAGTQPNYNLPCQIGSIQTMIRRPSLPNADYILYDECHHAMDDNSYGKLIRDNYPNAKVIGVTATPYRLAGKGFTKIFDCLVESLQLAEGINEGFLVPLRYFACPSPDMRKVHLSAGDYKEDESVKAMELVPIVESYLEHARGRSGICFAINVQHSRKIVDQYLAAGVRAEHIDANTPNDVRAAIFKRLRDKVTQVVVNVGIATEGVDIPNIEFVQCARPTKSLALWLQMCLDLKTEILTSQGWRKYDEVNNGDLVASFNLKDSQISFDVAHSKVVRQLHKSESFFSLKNPFIDIRVSNGHDLIIRKRFGRKRNLSKWTKQRIDDIKTEFQIPIAGFIRNTDQSLSDYDLRFIGWVLSDGTINKNTKAISISQSTAQPNYLHQSIIDSIVGCGFKYGTTKIKRKESKYKDLIQYRISYGNPRGTNKHLTGWRRLEKFIDKNISDDLMKISKKQLDVLLSTINNGDGSKFKTAYWTPRCMQITAGNNLIYAERLQVLCVINGYKCNLSTHYYNKSPIYNLHIKDKASASIKGINEKKSNHIINEGYSNEKIWCISSKHGTLITRRNGKVSIIGNCGRGTRVSNDLIKDAMSREERKMLIAASDKPHVIILDNAGLFRDHRMMPDQRIDWQQHFRGYKRERKPIEEMIEIFIAEDSSGREVRTKIPKEIEGLKLIEIIHQERERIEDLSAVKEFDRMYALFKHLPKIAKPGFKAYFEFKEYCHKNAILMNEELWGYLLTKLSTKAREAQLNEDLMTKKIAIERRWPDASFLLGKVNEHHTKALEELRRHGVPEGFLRKEREKYLLDTAVVI